MNDFPTRDPTRPGFWNERFEAGFTPWDARGVPAALTRFVANSGGRAGKRVLIPGCGSSYEAAALDAAGFDVLAIDYAPAAVERARALLAPAVAARVLQLADFFALESAPFDWIYERAFLPALPPALWPRWAARVAELLAPQGLLAGFFLLDATIAEPRRGPPFAATPAELAALLGHFDRVDDQPVPADESIPVFAGRERWMAWRRR